MIGILLIYIGLHTSNGLLLKELSLQGLNLGEILMLRGWGGVATTLILAWRTRHSLWPKSPPYSSYAVFQPFWPWPS